MSNVDESRAKSIQDGANVSTGGINYYYVDTTMLERLGIPQYSTKKEGGNNFIRIVAPSKTGPFAREIWVHRNVGSDGSTYLCMDRMFGEPCGVCQHIQRLKSEGGHSDTIKELAAGRRYLLFAVDVTSAESEEKGAHWFDCPISVYKAVCNLSKDKRTGALIDPTDPDNGRDVEFTRRDGKRTEYIGFVLRETKSIPKCWYEGLPTFDEILLKPNFEEVEKAVLGKPAEKSETTRSRDEDEDKKADPDSEERRSGSKGESRSRDSERGDSEQAKSVRAKLDEVRARRERR